MFFLPLFGNGDASGALLPVFSLTGGKRVVENRVYCDNRSDGAQRLLRRGARQLRQACLEQTSCCHRLGTVHACDGFVYHGKTAVCRRILPFRADYKGSFIF